MDALSAKSPAIPSSRGLSGLPTIGPRATGPMDDAEMDLLNMAIEAQVALCWLHACFKNNLPVSAELFADVTRSKNAATTMLGIEDPYREKAN